MFENRFGHGTRERSRVGIDSITDRESATPERGPIKIRRIEAGVSNP